MPTEDPTNDTPRDDTTAAAKKPARKRPAAKKAAARKAPAAAKAEPQPAGDGDPGPAGPGDDEALADKYLDRGDRGTGTPGGGQPIDVDAEASVVGALLVSADAYYDISETLTDEDFGHPSLAEIYRAVVACDNSGRPFDPVTVADELRSAGTFDRVGGKRALDRLVQIGRETINVTAHADIVASKAQLRRLIGAGRSITTSASEPGADGAQVLEDAEQAIFSLGETRSRSTLTPMAKAVAHTMTELSQARTSVLLGHSTGLEQLDKLTGGFQAGQLITLAARPAMGKSGLGLQIATHIAKTSGKAVAFLSYEMSISELTTRCIASALSYDVSKLRQNLLPDGMERDMARVAQDLSQTSLWIDDRPPATISGVRSSMRRLARRAELGCVVIDYLQLMEGDRRFRDSNRTQEVSDISRGLKRLSDELECPVVALSQLNRQLENRPNKRPQLSDLRESGSIEQDSSIVLFIYRDAVYNDASDPTEAELIIAKQRNGPVGTIPLEFNGPAVKFTTSTRELNAGGTYGDGAGAFGGGGGGGRWGGPDAF